MKEFSLKDKTVIVTGAMGLIGTEVFEALSMAGANIILIDILPQKEIRKAAEDLIKKHNNIVKGYSCSISNENDIKVVFKDICDHFKSIDVLINLAAIDAKFDKGIDSISEQKFENFPLAQWNKSIEINMTGTLIVTQAAVNKMIVQGYGNIINVASTYSIVSPNQNLYKFNGEKKALLKPIDYVATKSVIPNFTRYIATYYGKQNIRANTIVLHGIVDNPINGFKENFSKLSPMGRFCKLEEIRGPFIFLASDSSSYMTGSSLVIDGGWTAW